MAMQQNYPQGPQATFVSVPLGTNLSQIEKERIEKLLPKKTIKDLSTAQLIFGGIAAVTQVILIADGCGVSSFVGTGLWTGLFFAIAGGVGLMASQGPSYSTVTAFMALSIIASLFALPLIVFSGIGMGVIGYHHVSCRFVCGIQLLTGLAQGIVAITTAAFCCRVTCISPHSYTNVAFTRTGQEFTGMPISPLPLSTGGATQPTNLASVAGAVGHSPPAPPAYQEKQETRPRANEDPLGLQDPWQRFD